MRCPVVFALLLVAPCAAAAHAQAASAETDNHKIVYELGWAADWSRQERFRPTGATVAFEITPVEHWLEIEVGLTAIRSRGLTELPVDILFKKPWQLSPRFEVMVGIGPEIVHVSGRGHETFLGLSGVLDLMFWPKKNIGWYVEPAFETTFTQGVTHHGLGFAGGLLIGR
jgi:hypothetical protein